MKFKLKYRVEGTVEISPATGPWRAGSRQAHNGDAELCEMPLSWRMAVVIGHTTARNLTPSLDLRPSVDLALVLAWLGLETVDWRFRGRLREITMDGIIAVDMRLPEPWVRWLTAHGVGHHLLHTGSSFYLDSWQWVNCGKAERQAEEFAAGLLVPDSAIESSANASRVARLLGVPECKAA